MLQKKQNIKQISIQNKSSIPIFKNVNTFEFSSKPEHMYISGKIETNQTVPIQLYNMRAKLHLGRARAFIAANLRRFLKWAS